MKKSSFQYGMKISIENEIFIPGPSLTAEKQGPGLKFSIENEIFKPRMKISSENENFVRGGMVFSCVRARMNFFDPGALWERFRKFRFPVPFRFLGHPVNLAGTDICICGLFSALGLLMSLMRWSRMTRLTLANGHRGSPKKLGAFLEVQFCLALFHCLSLQPNLKHDWFTSKFANHISTSRNESETPFRGKIRMYPRSGFSSGGASAKTTLLENHPFVNSRSFKTNVYFSRAGVLFSENS